jgi:lysophospholipase L1-like esterase
MLKKQYPQARPKIVNKGIPGDTAQGGLERLRYDVIDQNPDCVLVQFALNDAFMGCNPRVYQNAVRAIINEIEDNTDAEIVLVTSVYIHNSPENDMAERFYAELEMLASELSLPIARVHEAWKKAVNQGVPFSSLVQFDGVHPTVEGYELMAKAIMEVFL